MSFKLKDAVTAASLLAALGAIVVAFDGRISTAAWLVTASWVIDALDGLVARLTKSANRFGAAFDDQVDHIAYTVAPGLILFAALRASSPPLAFAAAFVFILLGTIRLAVSSVTPLRAPGYWLGTPRPAAGFTIVLYLSSHFHASVGSPWVAAGLATLFAAAGLSHLPYKSHKGRLNWFEAAYPIVGLLTSLALYPFGFGFDSGFLWMFTYLFAPWILLNRRERQAIIAAAREPSRGPERS